MSVARVLHSLPAIQTSLLHYLSYLDPQQLWVIYTLAQRFLGRSAPPRKHDIELEERDQETGGFVKNSGWVFVPSNDPREQPHRVTYNIKLPPEFLEKLQEATARNIFGFKPNPSMSLPDLKDLCRKDPNFFNAAISPAPEKKSPFYKFIYTEFKKWNREKPRDIKFQLETMEMTTIRGELCISSNYRGTLLTQGRKEITFKANWTYNFLNPTISSRRLIVDDPERLNEVL